MKDDPKSRQISLEKLGTKCQATITEIGIPQDELTRLMGLGLCKGRKLQLLKGGDPLILRVINTRIGLSASLARKVVVEPC